MEISSEDLFEILVRENADMLSAFIRCYERNPAAVDDVFQETFLVAWQRIDDFDRKKPFAPWLRGIAFNVIRAQKRRNNKELLSADESLFDALDARFTLLSKFPGDTFDEQVVALRECLELLPADFQQPIELHYREECGVQAVAERLGISKELVKKRLQRGRKRLLECLLGKMAVLS